MDAHKKQPAGQSKYDLVKVKVWLGEHYYILSRFLISRMLTVTKIPYIKAVKIALELKKFFVDREELDISQPDLEEALFQIMHSRGFGDDYIRRYKMVTKFFQQKRPLIILLCGVSCTGKSTFAQQLASRLNLPNVLQTDVIYELLQLAGHCQAPKTAAHNSPPLDPQQIIAAFQRQCRDVRRGIDGDLTKSIRDGKPIIIEGLHLDPGLYLYEFGKYGVAHLLREHRLAADPDIPERSSDSQLLAEAKGCPHPQRKLQRSLSAQEVAFFLQRSSAPSTLSLSQASFQQKLAGALTSKSFDSGPAHQSSEFLQAVSMPPPMQQGPNSDAAGGTSEEMSGRSPASEWLQQFVPCFSGRQPQAAVTAPAPEATSRPDVDASASGSESWSHAPQGLLTSAVQQQPAQAVLGRGQLFHCWRRKSGPMTATSAGPAAAASARGGNLRRASFHAGTSADTLLPDVTTLHGSGRPSAAQPPIARPKVSDAQWSTSLPAQGSSLRKDASGPASWVQQPLAGPVLGVQQTQTPPHPPSASSANPAAPARTQRSSIAEDSRTKVHAPLHHPVPSQESLKRHTSSSRPGRSSSSSHSRHPGEAEPSEAGSLSSQALPSDSSGRQPPGAHAPGGEMQHEARAESVQPPRAAARGAAASASPAGQHGPLFVPIVLTLERQDHEVLLREVASRNLGSSKEADEWVEQALHQNAVLQEHLQTYASRSIPIVQLTLADFTTRLDTLHDYLLQCMEAAMSRQ